MIAVIIQARSSSKRLPGKALMEWGGTTLLGRVVDACRATLLPVWVATSTDKEDTHIAVEAVKHGAFVFRGSLDDVLGRFVGCVNVMPDQPEAVVRICADRPFLSTDLIVAATRYWQKTRVDYLKIGEGSLTVEVIAVEALRRANEVCRSPHDREHVTTGLPLFCSYEMFGSTVDTEYEYAVLAP